MLSEDRERDGEVNDGGMRDGGMRDGGMRDEGVRDEEMVQGVQVVRRGDLRCVARRL